MSAVVPPRRPDASMSLLSDLMSNTLDEGYGRAAQTRPPGTGGRGSRPGTVVLALVLAFAGLVLATAATQTRADAPALAETRTDLIDRIESRTDHADDLQQRLVALRAEVDAARDAALTATAAGSAARSDLERLSAVTGVAPVEGPGIKVVVDDAATGDAEPGLGTGRVLDTDLQRLLNGLWAAGAEAVSVNGQRITALTAVRSAGEAILVAYRPLSPPYEVLAIGDPDNLEVDFVDGPAGRWFNTLATFGIQFSVTAEDELELPGASAVTLRKAEPKAVEPKRSADEP